MHIFSFLNHFKKKLSNNMYIRYCCAFKIQKYIYILYSYKKKYKVEACVQSSIGLRKCLQVVQ